MHCIMSASLGVPFVYADTYLVGFGRSSDLSLHSFKRAELCLKQY